MIALSSGTKLRSVQTVLKSKLMNSLIQMQSYSRIYAGITLNESCMLQMKRATFMLLTYMQSIITSTRSLSRIGLSSLRSYKNHASSLSKPTATSNPTKSKRVSLRETCWATLKLSLMSWSLSRANYQRVKKKRSQLLRKSSRPVTTTQFFYGIMKSWR